MTAVEFARRVGFRLAPWQGRVLDQVLSGRRVSMAPVRVPRSHVVVVPAAACPVATSPPAAARAVVSSPPSVELDLLVDVLHPVQARPPCDRLGGHFPAARGGCFYGCKETP